MEHHQKTHFDGIVKMIEKRLGQQSAEDYYEQFIEEAPCPVCLGKRLSKNYLSVTVGGKNIDDFCQLSISKALEFTNSLVLEENEKIISKEILKATITVPKMK